MLRLGQLVQTNENLTGEAWFKSADVPGYDCKEVQIPSGAIGTVAGIYDKYNRVLVDLESGARLDFEPMSCFDVVTPFAGFQHDDICTQFFPECCWIVLADRFLDSYFLQLEVNQVWPDFGSIE